MWRQIYSPLSPRELLALYRILSETKISNVHIRNQHKNTGVKIRNYYIGKVHGLSTCRHWHAVYKEPSHYTLSCNNLVTIMGKCLCQSRHFYGWNGEFCCTTACLQSQWWKLKLELLSEHIDEATFTHHWHTSAQPSRKCTTLRISNNTRDGLWINYGLYWNKNDSWQQRSVYFAVIQMLFYSTCHKVTAIICKLFTVCC